MSEVRLTCQNGHFIVLDGVAKKIAARADKKLIVCPHCKPNNVQLSVLGDLSGKLFTCTKGHVVQVYPFANGYCNIACGSYHENIYSDVETMLDMISSGVVKCCAGKQDEKPCDLLLTALDDSPLETRKVFGIKTKTRVGDIWDRAKCPEPKETEVVVEQQYGVKEGVVKETEFSRINKRRVRNLRKARNTRPAGEIIDKPTNKSYRDGHNKAPNSTDMA